MLHYVTFKMGIISYGWSRWYLFSKGFTLIIETSSVDLNIKGAFFDVTNSVIEVIWNLKYNH